MLRSAGNGIKHPEETLPVTGAGVNSAKDPRQSFNSLPGCQEPPPQRKFNYHPYIWALAVCGILDHTSQGSQLGH